MVKFSENDSNYSVVVQKLAQILFSKSSSLVKTSGRDTLMLESSIVQRMMNLEAAPVRGPSYEGK